MIKSGFPYSCTTLPTKSNGHGLQVSSKTSDSLSIAFNEGLFSESFTIPRTPKCYIAFSYVNQENEYSSNRASHLLPSRSSDLCSFTFSETDVTS